MAEARTTRPTPQPSNGQSEVDYMADMLVAKVWQGNEEKRGLATQAASVALAAIQDYTAARYMETADEFTGRDLMQRWLNRHSLLEEARASVALDKGDGETQSVEGGAFTGKVIEHEAAWAVAGEGVYRCIRSWPDGTQCDARSAQMGHAVHRKMVPNDVARAWFNQPRFRRDAELRRITTEDRELLDRLGRERRSADEDTLDNLPDESPKLKEVAGRPRRFERAEGYARTGHTPEKRTPDEWCRILGVTILDPDGWRQDGKSWDEPITRPEFMRRMQVSTIEESDAWEDDL